MRFFATLITVLGVLGAGCAPKHESPIVRPPSSPGLHKIEVGVPMNDPTWQKRWWIERVTRLLRAGSGVGPNDDIHRLLKMTEDEIIAELMSDVRFADAVLDFNMYFMGFRADSLHEEDGGYAPAAFEIANAIQSAKAVLQNGDYLKLFEFDAGLFVPPLRIEQEEDEPMDPAKHRREVYNELRKKFRAIIKAGEGKPKGEKFCRTVATQLKDLEELRDRFPWPFDRVEVILERSEILPDGPDTSSCENPKKAQIQDIVEETQDQLEVFERGFKEILKYEPSLYQPKTVAEFKPFNLKAVESDVSGMFISFSNEMSNALVNSSTNMNRKRGAYVLKHFFCDDLTPVGFETPAQHVGGAHGSQTTCYACHYKLDPMAGFFRLFGSQFQDYSKQTDVIFDDGVTTNLSRYADQWRAKPGSGRDWEVGYVRSPDPRFISRNEYGETLADLTRILRGAPEVRRCLMKRLFNYAVADHQVIDGAYLDELTQKFDRDSAASNSSVAFKNALAQILKSRTFSEPNPDPQQCYDFGSGGTSQQAPPCRVASILETYCKNCHSSVNGPGRLDLTKWVPTPDGLSFTFPHLDRAGQPMGKRQTFAALSDRLSTSDPKRRMPKGGTMPSQERQQLYLWAQEEQ